MILFGERLKIVKEDAMRYIENKIDKMGPIFLSGDRKVYKEGEELIIGGTNMFPAQLSDIAPDELCEIADEIHTLPAKDLKI